MNLTSMRNLFFICLLIFNAGIYAQRPSELRKKQQEQQAAESEKPSERRNRSKENKSKEEVFGDDDPNFKVTAIPDKWKSESAVMIYQKHNYSYLRDNKAIILDETVRKRIKLLDKAAVTDFSEIYYVSAGSAGEIGIKIIKANGSVVDVDTRKAIEVNSGVPSFYRAYYVYSLSYKKLAVPDLEPGDIIDYYYRSKREETNSQDEYALDPFIFTLNSSYPILKQKFSFTVDRGFFINFNSYNGAPQLKEGDAGVDLRGRSRASIKTFNLEDGDREKLPKDVFNFHFRTSPTIKFQVVYASPSQVSNAQNFLAENNEAKKTVAPEEVQDLVVRKLGNYSEYISEINSYLSKNMRNEKDPIKLMKAAYYNFRYLFLDKYYGLFLLGTNTIQTTTGWVSKQDFVKINEEVFVSVMMGVAEEKNVKAHIVAGVSREIGDIKDVLLSNELSLAIKVSGTGNQAAYLFPFDNYRTVDVSNEELEGTTVYTFINKPTKRDKGGLAIEKLPVTSYQANKMVSALSVTLDEAMEMAKVSRKSKISGIYKESYSKLHLKDFDFLKEDKKKYERNYKDPEEEPLRGNKARIAEEKRRREAEKKEKDDKFKELLKDDLASEFDVESYDNHELIASGRFDEAPLEFNEEFKLKGLANKAGRNYSFNIGKLLGKQFELKEKDFTRNTDVFISFQRELINDIEVTLPEGYTCDGLQELNIKIDNESGSFISTATQNGNKLIVKTEKRYKKNADPKDAWKNYVAFLEAAYNFTQKKVILKKL